MLREYLGVKPADADCVAMLAYLREKLRQDFGINVQSEADTVGDDEAIRLYTAAKQAACEAAAGVYLF